MTNALPTAATNAAALDELRDIVGAVRVIDIREVIALIAVLLLVLALISLGIVLWRRHARKAPAQMTAPPVPPDERARRDLAAALRLLSDPDRFCTRVSAILRRYLEERFGLNAPDRTTEEFLVELHS